MCLPYLTELSDFSVNFLPFPGNFVHFQEYLSSFIVLNLIILNISQVLMSDIISLLSDAEIGKHINHMHTLSDSLQTQINTHKASPDEGMLKFRSVIKD